MADVKDLKEKSNEPLNGTRPFESSENAAPSNSSFGMIICYQPIFFLVLYFSSSRSSKSKNGISQGYGGFWS